MSKSENLNQKCYYPLHDVNNSYKITLSEITEVLYRTLYPEIRATQKRTQHHHRCMYTRKYIWKCDGNCDICEYHATGDMLSLDVSSEDVKANLKDNGKSVPDLAVIKVAFRNGAIKKSNNPAYTNFFFTNTSAIIILGVVNSDCSLILNHSEFYLCAYGCTNISFYVCSSFSNKKISARSKFHKRLMTVSRFVAKLILSLFSPLIQATFSLIKEMTSAEMLQLLLVVVLLAICLIFCVVFLIIAFQNFINNRKYESRKHGSAQRDLEFREVRMKKQHK